MVSETAAHLACREGHSQCVRILADTQRVDWNKTDSRCRTPLYWALERGHPDIVDILVKQPNIDYNVKTKKGETLAQVAVREGGVRCVETLAAEDKFDCWNVPDRDGDTSIMMALKMNKKRTAWVLAQCPRVDLRVRDADRKTVAQVAVKRGAVRCVETLLTQNIFDSPEEEDTLISFVFKFGSAVFAKTLLDNGLADRRDQEGWSWLFRAIKRGKLGEKN